MELKAGYKQTEVGVIPEDLDLVRFKQIVEDNRIPSGIYKDKNLYGQGTKIIKLGDVFGYDYFNPELAQRVQLSKDEIANYLVKVGCIVIALASVKLESVGKVMLVTTLDEDTVFDHNVALISVIKGVDQKYVFHLFKSNIVRRLIGTQATQVGTTFLKTSTILEFLISLPPTKAEQEAIAEALSDADALIESLEQLIAKKRLIKQGAMQELLRQKDGWYIKKLEDIADVIDPHPSHRAPAVSLNGIPFVGIGDLNEMGDLIGTKIRMVDPSVFDEHLVRYNLNDELIGLGRVASIGKVVKLKHTDVNYTISPTLGVIRGTKVQRDYLFCALKSKAVTDQFNKIMSGSTRSSVGMEVLRKLDIALPATETEQTAIATILSDMDTEINELDIKLSKARKIKQGMMQALLTGKTRLV